MQTILIIEPDNGFAQALAQELKKIGPTTISTVPTLPEGCLILSQRQQSLVFMPVGEDTATLVRALRALQPGVPIILTLGEETAVSPAITSQIQGMLTHKNLKSYLPQLLAQTPAFVPVRAADPAKPPAASPTPPPLPTTSSKQPIRPADIQHLFDRVELGELVQTIILSQGETVIASHGRHKPALQKLFISQIGADWNGRYSARLQFHPTPNGNVQLYARALSDGYLLTLVAMPEASLRELRMRGEALTAVIQQLLDGRQPETLDTIQFSPSQPGQREKRISYNIAWQPQKPLRPDLQIPLRRALQRLAHENACVLTYVTAAPELIHLHINCPATRGSDWVAYLLKNGSEAIIQKEYHLDEPLWATGFYAAESAKPLSDNELRLLLEKRELL
ncbi:MAG: hypothetical protein R3C62_07400 [Chloroflexota bacterium]